MLSNNAVLIEVKEITKNIKEFTVQLDEESEPFKAGQYCVFGCNNEEGKMVARPYSIASAPSKNIRKFYIVLVENGALTPNLFKLKAGDKVFVSPRCVGHMTYVDNLENSQNIIFFATGTGIAPFHSILNEYEEVLNEKKITLVQGTRFEEELGYLNYFKELEKKYPNFRYIPSITRQDWDGHKGRITSILNEGLLDEELRQPSLKIMMCGSLAMTAEAVEILKIKGVSQENIIKEGY
ncbi:MAG: ferredoxin--NADP reductase [Rickettsiales bacterium]|jgi:ferredoxin--NADP+ reductase|nr:ferredoxin--NADP reductase [Rickettsiales bacterium]